MTAADTPDKVPAKEPAAREARWAARAAGLLYLGTIAGGLYAQLATRSALVVRGDAGATAQNILANLPLFRAGLAADLFMLLCYVGVVALLYGLFKAGGKRLSLTAAGLGLTGIAVLGATSILHSAALLLASEQGAEAANQILLALRLHGRGYGISLVFFGAYCMAIGWLAIRSRAVPVAVGALMMIGGGEHLVSQFGALLAPDLVAALPRQLGYLPLLGEAVLALWLTVFAVRAPAD